MKIITYEQRVLVPAENKWLYNKKEGKFSLKLFLAVDDTEEGWTDITEEEKIEIERKQQEEIDIME